MFGSAWFKAAAVAGSLVAAIAVGAGQASAQPTPRPGYGQAELQRDLDAIYDSGAPGVLAEVDTDGRRQRGSSGVADLDVGGQVDPASYFRMGSDTKTFVAVVVLQ